MKKKNRKRKYPFPRPDEKRNRELRDARAVNTYGEKPLDARDIGNTQSAYNRQVNNEARKSFEEIDKLRGQMEFIEDLPNLKARKTVAIKQQVKRMINRKPWHKFSSAEMVELNNLGTKLKNFVIRQNEKRHGN